MPPRLAASSTFVSSALVGLRLGVALHGFFDGTGLRAGAQHQRGFEAVAGGGELLHARGELRVALAHAWRVDEHEALLAELFEQRSGCR